MSLKNTMIAVALAAALPFGAWAETRAERLALAQQHIQTTMEDMDMSKVIEQMWRPIVPQIEASGTKLNADQLERIRVLYSDMFTEPMTGLMLRQADLMADMMTLDEIAALNEFYSTPLGRSVMRKLPDVIGAQQPMILEMVQSRQGELMSGLQEIVANP